MCEEYAGISFIHFDPIPLKNIAKEESSYFVEIIDLDRA